jgi:hypothetical protein
MVGVVGLVLLTGSTHHLFMVGVVGLVLLTGSTHHLFMVWVVGLVYQGEVLLAQPPLQVDKMSVDPGSVLLKAQHQRWNSWTLI